jgi:hypothetical protein
VRGQSALNYNRKSFSMKVMPEILLQTNDMEERSFEKFKLLSLVFDYTYIENRFGHLMLNEVGLWPLHSFFTQVFINNTHKGLYLFVENPEEHFFNMKNAEAVIRRYYRGQISKTELNYTKNPRQESYYQNKFFEIYKLLNQYSGQQLYNELSKRMNIDYYMRKMAIDMILENGDTTDEVFFCAIPREDNIYFEILPWDYDDLFSNRPHEIGRPWAVGDVFGERVYDNIDDVESELQGRLIFSVEDDIDYIIAKDDYLYSKYIVQLKYVLSKLSDWRIDAIFSSLYTELYPYYEISEVIEQSQYDVDSTSVERFTSNFKLRKNKILSKVNYLKGEVGIQ